MSNHRVQCSAEANGVINIPPAQLQERIVTSESECPLWKYLLPQRLASAVAPKGAWIANEGKEITCVAHVEPDFGRVYLFYRDPSLDEASIAGVLRESMNLALAGGNNVTFRLSALDRRLVETTRKVVHDQYHSIESFYDSPCGMFINSKNHPVPAPPLRPSNVKLRFLASDDTTLVNSRWEYRSKNSLSMIQEMIASKRCRGLEVDGQLVSWACQYLDGPLGMLWTEEDHRRKGYGELIVAEMMNIGTDLKTPWLAFVVDSNAASIALFAKLKWERVADAHWVAVTVRRQEEG